MNIHYLGQSSFSITGKNAKIVTDPFDPATAGIPFPSVSADIVTLSGAHFNDAGVVRVEGEPLVIRVPGEFERKGARVYGYPGQQTVFKFVIDGITVLHGGTTLQVPEEETLEDIKGCDILTIPVGIDTINDPKAMKEFIAMIAPSIVIPMYFSKETLEQFLQLGIIATVRRETICTVSPDTLPEEREIVVLTR